MTMKAHSGFGFVSKLRWYVAVLEQHLTHKFIAAVSVLMLWAGVAMFVNAPLREVRDSFALKVKSLESRQEFIKDRNALHNTNQKSSLAYQFPSVTERDEQLSNLLDLVRRQGITLGRVDYKLEQIEKVGISKLHVKLTMIGDISSQRRLVGLVVKKFNNLSIDAAEYDRENGSDTRFSSRMNLSLYYKIGERK